MDGIKVKNKSGESLARYFSDLQFFSLIANIAISE
jgi:hypothetical protein